MKYLKIILLSLVSLILCNPVFSGTMKYDVRELNIHLHGKVKSVKIFRFQKSDNDKQGKKWLKSIINYNRQGNVIEFITYWEDGKFSHSYKYKYNAKGHPLEMMYSERIESIIASKNIYKRNSNGWIIEDCQYNRLGKQTSQTLYKLDGHGNRVEETYYATKGSFWENIFGLPISYKYSHTYDSNGNEIKRFAHENKGKGKAKLDFSNKYNKKNKVIEFKLYDNHGKQKYVINYSYNAKNNILKSNDSRNKGPTNYRYEYDKQSNWTKRWLTYLKHKAFKIEREITYYE